MRDPQAKRKGQPLGLQRARFYAAEIIAALAHVHELKIIHRDLKVSAALLFAFEVSSQQLSHILCSPCRSQPGNVMLSTTGHVKLLDFGLGRRDADDAVTSLVGTPKYVAPEILRIAKGEQSSGYGKAIDYWSLGVMLYEMLVGNTPFEVGVRSRQELYKKILGTGRSGLDLRALLSQYRTLHIDKHAASVIQGLLDRDPTKRFGGSEEPAGMPRSLLEHPFFSEIDWLQLLHQKAPAPWVPTESEVERQLEIRPEEVDLGSVTSASGSSGAGFGRVDGFTFDRRTAKAMLGKYK